MSPVDEIQEWVEEYGSFLYRFALARVSDEATAEDLVQITFMAALKARERFEGKSSVKTWLVSILRHKIIDHFRKNAKHEMAAELPEMEALFQNTFNEQNDWRQPLQKWPLTPEQLLGEQDLQETLWKCVEGLPPRMKTLFLLREVDGETTDTICEDMELSLSNFGVMMHRIRHRLRDCFARYGFFSIDSSKL